MDLNNPEFYLNKKIRVFFHDGDIISGELEGFNFDYDDNENLFVEFDMTTSSHRSFGFTNRDIEQIDII